MHVEPEAEYTDAACVPYTASALAIGEESIYARCAVGLSWGGIGDEAGRSSRRKNELALHGRGLRVE